MIQSAKVTLRSTAVSVRALWRITSASLSLNDVLKAGKTYVKFHLLFAVSAIIAQVNKLPTLVVNPSATVKAAERANEILPLAATCVENALQSALQQAQLSSSCSSAPDGGPSPERAIHHCASPGDGGVK
ncbi:hypothetical protein WME75_21750 [Sorangium sp. So ce1014]|uniref:hypothetical protein n=1 Tax=Sorangium sp. So ce1014 TaxID=3133326 RepID=UPI003F6309E2